MRTDELINEELKEADGQNLDSNHEYFHSMSHFVLVNCKPKLTRIELELEMAVPEIQSIELEVLESIYSSELEIQSRIVPQRLSFKLNPFLEMDNLEFYDFTYYPFYVSLSIDLPENYPFKAPIVTFYASNELICCRENVEEMTKIVDQTFELRKGESMLLDIIESLRVASS